MAFGALMIVVLTVFVEPMGASVWKAGRGCNAIPRIVVDVGKMAIVLNTVHAFAILDIQVCTVKSMSVTVLATSRVIQRPR